MPLAILPLVGLFSLLVWALLQSGGMPSGSNIFDQPGEVSIEPRPAPNFTLLTIEGESIDLNDLHGKVVMIDFWASWCPPCVHEAPTLRNVYQEYKNRGVEFIGVAIWDSEMDISMFIEKFNVPYPNGLDKTGTIAIDYGVSGIPEKHFVDRRGWVAKKFTGPMDEEQLHSVLNALLVP